MHDHGLGQHGLDGQGADGLLHEQHGGEEADAAHHVHPQGAGRVALGFAGAVMADEEEGTQGGDFPEEEHPCEAVAEDEAVHRAKEQQQEEENDEWIAGIRQGLGELFEDGWTTGELDAMTQDEAVQREIADGHGVVRAAWPTPTTRPLRIWTSS